MNPPSGGRRWRPAPFIQASFAIHGGAAAAALLHPEFWPWAVAAVAADQAMLTAAGLWPRSSLLGPNLTRLPASAAARGEVAITLDDGPDPEVTPAVLDLLERRGAPATFFCIGQRALNHPGLCRRMVECGHAVENHSFRHRHDFAFSGLNRFERELEAAQEALARLTGTVPSFFRAPAGLRNPLLEPALQRVGLRLASWSRRGFDTRDRNPERVCGRLLEGLEAGDILLLHDGNGARTAAGTPVILEVLPRLLDALARRNLRPVTLAAAVDGTAARPAGENY